MDTGVKSLLLTQKKQEAFWILKLLILCIHPAMVTEPIRLCLTICFSNYLFLFIIISFSFLLLYQLLMSLCINFICSVHISLEWLSALLPFPSQDLIAFNLLSIFSDPFFLALVPISAYSFFILFSRLVLLLI
jgi:hypothetical protein